MIEVTCPSSRRNNHIYLYNMRNDMSLINLSIDQGGVKFEVELTVAEAEHLANELMGWVKEFKPDGELEETP